MEITETETSKPRLELHEIAITPLPEENPPVNSFAWIRKNPKVNVATYEDEKGKLQHFSWIPKNEEPRYISINNENKFPNHISLVEDTKLRRTLIAKSGLKNISGGWSMFRDITEETQKAGVDSHPNIATIHDTAAGPNNVLYAIMEYLPNGTLEDWIKKDHPVENIAKVIEQVSSGIHHVNTKRNMVYADTKPLNVGFDIHWTPKLIDFEYAARIKDGGLAINTGARTPIYAAPEQVQDQPLSVQTDVYSFGTVVFSMLITSQTNYHDYELNDILSEFKSNPNAEIPFRKTYGSKLSVEQKQRLNIILHKALSDEPTKRHVSIKEFNQELQEVLNPKNK